MKNQFLKLSFFLSLSFFLLLDLPVFSQTKEDQQACLDENPSPNPEFPGCQPPDLEDVFKVLLVIDESGTMGHDPTVPPIIRQVIRDFAVTLRSNARDPGQFEMGVLEFSSVASLKVPLTDVTSSSFLGMIDDYRNNEYNPLGGTNFTNPLSIIFTDPELENLDIVFFISDGNPNDPISNWQPYADQIKCIMGTYIFGIALGDDIIDDNIVALSGPDKLNDPKTLIEGADWLREDISGIADALVDLANSLIDNEAPILSCKDIKGIQNNDGACNAIVNFNLTVEDNCTSPSLVCIPPSGSAFEIGTTTVNCTATDAAGNSSTCSFTVTVNDTEAPRINCSNILDEPNDIGECSAKVDFSIFTRDNCTAAPRVVSNPPSGSAFPVGTTLVTSTSTDESGNSASCSFIVTVLDQERPIINCPPDTTINIEDSTDPSNTGMPVVTDNCSVGLISHTDNQIDGSCNSEFLLNRTWVATDIYANTSRCRQNIQVVDITPPVITLPPDIEVTCDTTVTATGEASVIDNGDPNPELVYSDVIVSGNCDIRCTINRIWRATDECGNTSIGTQVIEKDITPLVRRALEADINQDGVADPLILGVTQTTLSIKQDNAECITQWLPYNEVRPAALKRGNQEVEDNCQPGTNEVDEDNRLLNPLFGEGLKLSLYLRLHPEFGETKLSALDCEIAPIVLQKLSNDPDVNEFMRVGNIALGNLVLVPHLRELLEAFKCINGPLDLCD